jgi:hypothetical protein
LYEVAPVAADHVRVATEDNGALRLTLSCATVGGGGTGVNEQVSVFSVQESFVHGLPSLQAAGPNAQFPAVHTSAPSQNSPLLQLAAATHGQHPPGPESIFWKVLTMACSNS